MSSCIDCLNACWHYENAWAGMVLLRVIVYHEVLFCERPYNNITHTHIQRCGICLCTFQVLFLHYNLYF